MVKLGFPLYFLTQLQRFSNSRAGIWQRICGWAERLSITAGLIDELDSHFGLDADTQNLNGREDRHWPPSEPRL